MSSSNSDKTLLVVQLVRTFELPPDNLFSAWTEPDKIKVWWRASDEYTVTDAQINNRVGGAFRFVMQNRHKQVDHVATGTIRETIPAQRLVMNWNWEGEMEGDESLLSLQFTDLQNGKTELTLRHEKFPTIQFRNDHEKGWIGCLRALAEEIEKGNLN